MSESNEIWQNSPKGFIANDVIVSVSNKGRVKTVKSSLVIPSINPFGCCNTHGKYAGIKLDGQDYYLHRLVYWSFHSEEYYNKVKGRIQFKSFKPEMLNDDGMLRCHLEDLIFIKSTGTNNQAKQVDDDVIEADHPEYGAFIFNKWMPLYTHIYDETSEKHIVRLNSNYEIVLFDDKENPCSIRNVKSGKNITINGTIDKSISVSYNKISKKSLLTHILLASIFPEIEPNATVDHIDNNASNNHITNLMWMSCKDNAKKGQEACLKTERSCLGVQMLSGIKLGPKTVIKEFKSVNGAAEFIHKDQALTSQVGTIWSKIRRAMNNFDKEYTAYGYFWKEIEKEEPTFPGEEIWKPFSKGCSKYEVSNYGRVKNTYRITLGKKVRGRKYRLIDITKEKISATTYVCEKYYIHRLVWEVFNGPIPEKMIILHDEKAPLDEEGCYRNWLEDLSIGTRSQNNFEHHEAVKTLTKQK